jgi:hypothetical protein
VELYKATIATRANIVVALTLGMSLVGFVLYQVYKIVMQIKHFTFVRYLLSPNRTLGEFFDQYNRLEKIEAEQALRGSYVAVFVIYYLLRNGTICAWSAFRKLLFDAV